MFAHFFPHFKANSHFKGNASFPLYTASSQPTFFLYNCHQHCPIPGSTWDNLGQNWRKPHYCLWSSPLQTILVSGGISLSKVVFQQLCCGVRWDNTTGNSQELGRNPSLPEDRCPSTAAVVAHCTNFLLDLCKTCCWGDKTTLTCSLLSQRSCDIICARKGFVVQFYKLFPTNYILLEFMGYSWDLKKGRNISPFGIIPRREKTVYNAGFVLSFPQHILFVVKTALGHDKSLIRSHSASNLV